ncbi:barnase inhibitor [Glaciihabitans arcticus]|uniref:Barnase inhibitor n=2 Tax=Glaciihabitans arcticus TaxID=2668039 RepID=A0A4Q9GY61_9MICO|nr:barnase inhibitor [Glaciihabitans arcticus]
MDACREHARAAALDWLQVDTALAGSIGSFFKRWNPYKGASWNAVGGTNVNFVLDGERFSGLTDFYRHIGEVVNGPGGYFGGNLDALADCLSGGFGTPAPDEQGFQFVWLNSEIARTRLGYPETVHQLRARLTTCHSSNIPAVRADLEEAMHRRGPTVFDSIVEIFEKRKVPLLLK